MAITNKIQLLALDMADLLRDRKHFGLYIRIAKKFPEGYIRQKMSEIKEARDSGKKIENWGAYFTAAIYKGNKR